MYKYFAVELSKLLKRNLADAKKAEAAINKEHKARRSARYHYRLAMKPLERRKVTPTVVLADSTSGILHTSQEKVSEITACHFENLFARKSSPEFDQAFLSTAEEEISSIDDDPNAYDPLTDADISFEEVQSALKDSPNHKCPGSDLQPYAIYKYSGDAGARIIRDALNRFFLPS